MNHHPHTHNYVYDPNDGRPRNWLTLCRVCEARIPHGAQFCKHCGSPTRKPITEAYRNRTALLTLVVILGFMMLGLYVVRDDPTMRWSLVGGILLMGFTITSYLLRRKK